MSRLTAVRTAGLLALLCLSISCGGDDGPRKASAIVFTPDPATVPQGGTLQLIARVVDDKGHEVANQSVEYSSGDGSLLSVSPTGMVTSLGVLATVSITAAQGDVFSSIDVTVQAVPGSIEPTPVNVALASGGTQQLTVTVKDILGDTMEAPVTYSGDNNAVFTVSPTGLVTSVGPDGTGTVTITSDTVVKEIGVFVGTVPAGTLLANIPVAGAPYSVAVSATGKMILSLAALTKVARGDISAYSFPTLLEVGLIQPLGVIMNPAGTKAYVGLPQGIAVVDLVTNAVSLPISGAQVGQVFSVAISPDGARLYASSTGGKVYAINTATNVVTDSSATIGIVEQLAVHPTLQLVYGITDDGTYELNASTLAAVRTFSPTGKGIAVTPDGSELYAISEFTGMRVITLSNGNVTPVATSAGFGVAVRDNEVIIAGGSTVQFINRSTLGIIRTLTVGSNNRRPTATPSGVIVVPDEDGRVLFLR